MDQSFRQSIVSKFPSGEPTSEWTIEQLLHWSLNQYHTKVIDQTSQNINALREQCNKECEDVLELHTLAVDMANKKKSGGESGGSAADELPHQVSAELEDGKPSASTNTTNPATNKSTTTPTSIQVQITQGSHKSQTFLLRPTIGTPCLIGRSKGKKFIKNGISLYKDQEVSTTHGKFILETNNNSNGGESKYYYMDVGSTNGTVYNAQNLVPNERLELVNGMELKVGNSVLRIVLG